MANTTFSPKTTATTAKRAPSLEKLLSMHLDQADHERDVAKANKKKRAVDAMYYLDRVFDNLAKSGKVTLLATFLKRSEFAGLIRLACANVFLNCQIEGRGDKLTIKFSDGGKPLWNTPARKEIKDFAENKMRIDDKDVKEYLGIPITIDDAREAAIKAIKNLSKKTFEVGKESIDIFDVMPEESKVILEHLINSLSPEADH